MQKNENVVKIKKRTIPKNRSSELKWREVIEEYLSNEPRNWTKAYRKIYGVKTTVAKANVSRLLSNANFQVLLEAAFKRIEEKPEITNEMIARKLWDLANYDLRKIADPETGDYLDVHQIDKDTARIIQGFDIDTEIIGEGEKQRAFAKRRYRFPNRAEPLIALAKSRGMFNDGNPKEQYIINIIADPRVCKHN